MKKEQILFVKKYDTNPKFMSNDFEILEEKYSVKLNNVKTTNDIFIIISLIKEFFYLIFNIRKFRIVFIWFADYHSFLSVLFAKIFRKKCVICAGGYECTYIPEINCGVFTRASIAKAIRSFCASYSLKHCSLVLPVDESLIENINTYIYSDILDKESLHDGIKNFIPDIKTAFEVIYLGYDSRTFNMEVEINKVNSVLSAGLIVNEDEYRRKGFDILIEAAKIMKDVQFALVGLNDEYYNKLTKLGLQNIHLLKILSYEKLIEEYSKAKVFAQLSMFEGMPSTICEAMMCECIPVGSNVNGIPKIIGDCGFLVYKKYVKEVVNALYRALDSSYELGIKSRNRILSNFSLEIRKEKLLSTLDKLLSKKS